MIRCVEILPAAAIVISSRTGCSFTRSPKTTRTSVLNAPARTAICFAEAHFSFHRQRVSDHAHIFASRQSGFIKQSGLHLISARQVALKKSGETELFANFVGGERRFALVAGAGFEQVKVVVQIFHLLAQ